MAIGDDATAAGFPLVPNTGEEGKVRYGAREINRTRDFVAQTKALIPSSVGGFRTAAGISMGETYPTVGDLEEGEIYLYIVPA